MPKPNVMLLGFTVPDAVAQNIFTLDSGPAVQTHKFAWSLTRALKAGFGLVILASACPIQNYPLGKRILFKGGKFKEHDVDGVMLGFINLIILKHLTRFIACVLVLPRVIVRNQVDLIFVHGTHTPFLIFGLLSKLFGKRLVVVLTDPPGVLLPTDKLLSRILKKIDIYMVRIILRFSDAVISLAPELINRFAVNKPFLVFPGILESRLTKKLSMEEKNHQELKPFTILYAGGLSKAYGVDRLLEAISSFDQSKSIQLRLFGRGDQEVNIQQLVGSDARFYYGGFVSSEALIPELLQADLLINPRPTHEAFAGMSFPSKLIEYLAIGRPVLTTKIASIPESYRPYFSFIEDESPKGIKKAIENVMEISPADRDVCAAAGKEFVSSNASELVIGSKIANLVEHLKSKY
jgi:glycosyltransferase involved in cell wall biosynthesis